MGDIREEIEEWYLRDYVEEKVETRLIEALSLSDLVFSRNKRVKASTETIENITLCFTETRSGYFCSL